MCIFEPKPRDQAHLTLHAFRLCDLHGDSVGILRHLHVSTLQTSMILPLLRSHNGGVRYPRARCIDPLTKRRREKKS